MLSVGFFVVACIVAIARSPFGDTVLQLHAGCWLMLGVEFFVVACIVAIAPSLSSTHGPPRSRDQLRPWATTTPPPPPIGALAIEPSSRNLSVTTTNRRACHVCDFGDMSRLFPLFVYLYGLHLDVILLCLLFSCFV